MANPMANKDTNNDDLRTRYHHDGFVVLRRVFSEAEVRAVADEADGLLQRTELQDQRNLRVRWQYHHDTGAPLFEVYDPVLDLAPRCHAWSVDERVLGVLRHLLGDQVHPIKDKLIYKLAGSGGYPLHQDYIAWPTLPESFTTVTVAIDQASAENGWIEVFPRAHEKGCLSERDGNFHMLPDDSVAGYHPLPLDLGPGDVAIFGGFMPHRSGTNRSAGPRRHLLLSYNTEKDGGSQHDEHYQAFHHYLRGIYGMMGLGDMYFR